jgi:pyridoxine 4-dehydrogenase
MAAQDMIARRACGSRAAGASIGDPASHTMNELTMSPTRGHSDFELVGTRVPRIGYGTMQLTGPGVLGPPADPVGALRLLDRALRLRIAVFDTAWYYGPDIPNQLLAQALRRHSSRVVIATKLGWEYDSSRRLVPAQTPELLRAGMRRDLGTFGAGAISIVHLRWGNDRAVTDQFRRALATMTEMRDNGSFVAIGLSNVSAGHLEYALTQTAIGSVSNSFSVTDQGDGEVLDLTTREGIAYLPWLPLRTGTSSRADVLQSWAQRLAVTPAQVALAWLLHRAPNIIPIPGTSNIAHLEENHAAEQLQLPAQALADLRAAR